MCYFYKNKSYLKIKGGYFTTIKEEKSEVRVCGWMHQGAPCSAAACGERTAQAHVLVGRAEGTVGV